MVPWVFKNRKDAAGGSGITAASSGGKIERANGGAAALVPDLSEEGIQAAVETFVAVHDKDPSFRFVEGMLIYLNQLAPERTVELVRRFLQSSGTPSAKRGSRKRRTAPEAKRGGDA